MNTAPASAAHGVFHLGAMQMALHLDSLREVVPLGEPVALPCGNPAVLGGVDLRGVLVPVLDLRRQLAQPCTGQPANVVIMSHGEHLLGLLVQQVTGVFDCPAQQHHTVDATAGQLTLLKGSFPHPENGSPISVLDPQRLAALPDLPLARAPLADPALSGSGAHNTAATEPTYVLLTRCAGLHLALPSQVVHSTVLNPEVHASALAGGYCRGSIDVAGVQVAAIDLAAFCGMAWGTPTARRQAFVVRYADGLLAFLVDEITDVIPASPRAALPLPHTALPRPELFAGVLPAEALQDHATTEGGSFYLLLDGDRLVALPELMRYASLNTGSSSASAANPTHTDNTGDATSGPLGRVLTFDLGGAHAATPIEHVSEIVPWAAGTALFDDAGPALGLMVNRGRVIPTYSLAALLGRPLAAPLPDASVLVVSHGPQAVGFTVPRLIGIEDVHWMPQEDRQRFEASQPGDSEGTTPDRLARVLVADAQGQRMLNLLDLLQMARRLLHTGV